METAHSEDVVWRTWFERIHTCPLGGRTDPPEKFKNRSNELVRFIENKGQNIQILPGSGRIQTIQGHMGNLGPFGLG